MCYFRETEMCYIWMFGFDMITVIYCIHRGHYKLENDEMANNQDFVE